MHSTSNYEKYSGLNMLDDGVADEAFLNHSPSGPKGYMLPKVTNNFMGNLERQELIEKKKKIEENTLMLTNDSLNYLKESEQVGIATAEELLKQREKLQRTEKNLDEIQNTLKYSDRHIRGMKSIFGRISNLWNKPNNTSTTTRKTISVEDTPSKSNLEKIIEKSDSDYHPALRAKGLEGPSDLPFVEDTQQAIDKNLDVMLGSITKLKGLANGLNIELDAHNELIDNIMNKADSADITISRQHKDVKRLLN